MTTNEPASTEDLEPIRDRVAAAEPAIWGAYYDGSHPTLGPHWELRLRDGHGAIIGGGYDEWRPILDLICNAPDDIKTLLTEVDRIRAERDAVAAKVAAALELHRPVALRGEWVCNACTPLNVLMQTMSGRGRGGVAHPCPTRRALGDGGDDAS